MTGTAPPPDASVDDQAVAKLKAERDALQNRLEKIEKHRTHRVRGITAGFLVFLTAVVFSAAVTGLWLRANTLRTDRFVALVGPLGSDPDVQTALADFTSAQLQAAVDIRSYFEELLPPRAQPLAIPLSAVVTNFLSDRVHTFFTSDRFEQLWRAAVERAHKGFLRVIDNDNENVQVQNGQVVLNLIPIFNNVLQEVEQRASGILGRDINLPDVTPGMLPDEARQRIEDAIGRPLPKNWGTVVVFEADRLTAMQRAVEVFKRGTALLAIAAVLLLALTIWVAPRRRRTVLQLALAIGLVTVLLRRVVFTAQGEVLGSIKVEQNQKAASNVLDHVLGGYLGLTVAILWVCVVVALVAFLVGPARPAVAVRRSAVSLWHATTGAVSRTSERTASIGWVQEHREALQVGVGVLAVLYLLIADVSWWRLLITAVIVGVLELVLARAAPSAPPSSPPASDAPAA